MGKYSNCYGTFQHFIELFWELRDHGKNLREDTSRLKELLLWFWRREWANKASSPKYGPWDPNIVNILFMRSEICIFLQKQLGQIFVFFATVTVHCQHQCFTCWLQTDAFNVCFSPTSMKDNERQKHACVHFPEPQPSALLA